MTTFFYTNNRIKSYHDQSNEVIRIEWENGCIEHYENGVLHCSELDENGNLKPALIHSDGSKEYWINGKRRKRADGPSIEWANGIIEYHDEEKF